MTVRTRDIWEVLVSNELFFSKMEQGYAKRLVRWSSSANSLFNYESYLKFVKSLGLAKQKQEVNFLVRIFAQAGIKLGYFELRFYQNGGEREEKKRDSLVKKHCLATDVEIQKLFKNCRLGRGTCRV